jgi:hypothetical protein
MPLKTYQILDVYRFEGYRTFVVEAVEDTDDDLPLFGTFELELINANEVELDPIADANFIQQIKDRDIFFTDIKDIYYDVILESIGLPDSVKGYKIVEPI